MLRTQKPRESAGDDRVVARSRLPMQYPLVWGVVFALACDLWDTPDWLGWILAAGWGFWFLAVLLRRQKEVEVDPFRDGGVV
jgi:hypothetical protein